MSPAMYTNLGAAYLAEGRDGRGVGRAAGGGGTGAELARDALQPRNRPVPDRPSRRGDRGVSPGHHAERELCRGLVLPGKPPGGERRHHRGRRGSSSRSGAAARARYPPLESGADPRPGRAPRRGERGPRHPRCRARPAVHAGRARHPRDASRDSGRTAEAAAIVRDYLRANPDAPTRPQLEAMLRAWEAGGTEGGER